MFSTILRLSGEVIGAVTSIRQSVVRLITCETVSFIMSLRLAIASIKHFRLIYYVSILTLMQLKYSEPVSYTHLVKKVTYA